MITLRSNPYTPEELRALIKALSVAEDSIMQYCDVSASCKQCNLRHVCYDVTSVKEHALRKLKELQKR